MSGWKGEIPEITRSRLRPVAGWFECMFRSSEPITKAVRVEVPPEVEQRARERAGEDGDLELHLLDEFLFEYEWVFEGENEE